MKFFLLTSIAFLVLNAKTCNFTVNVSPRLSVQEDSLLRVAKDSFQAETVKVMRVEEGGSILERSLHVTLLNCKRITLEDKSLRNYIDFLFERVMEVNNYEKKYDEIEIGFEEKTGPWFYNKSKEQSSVFTQKQMDELIDHHLGPIKVLTRRINQLNNNENYQEMILLGDSLEKLGPPYMELGEQAEGVGYLYLNDSLTALKYFLLAKENDPENGNNYENLTMVYSRMNNYKLAISNMDTAIKLDPQNSLFYYVRVQYYHKAGNDQAACKDEEKASDLVSLHARTLTLSYCK
jgi:tetratricopeptide (TPR) repeat protein